jgi:hypothetical protein
MGRPGAVAMGLTPAIMQRSAIVIQTATNKLVRLYQTKKLVSSLSTLNSGASNEVTVMARASGSALDLQVSRTNYWKMSSGSFT